MASLNFLTKKRILLVNRDFQFRYMKMAVIIGISATVFTSIIILFPLYQFEVLRTPNFLPVPILVSMMFSVVVNVCLIGIMTIWVTHKIAGPMFSMSKSFRKIEDGNWSERIKVRHGDDLLYVIRNFNLMIGSIEKYHIEDLIKINSILYELRNYTLAETDSNFREFFISQLISLYEGMLKRSKAYDSVGERK